MAGAPIVGHRRQPGVGIWPGRHSHPGTPLAIRCSDARQGECTKRLKPINEQVVAIAGAASGIGRESALRFAERGAKVFVAARSEPGLTSLVNDITARGGQAALATCDVADFAQVEATADAAEGAHGRIDTWVNDAAVSTYARFEETSLEEIRRIMDVNFMGQVHGAKAALPHLRREG